MLRSWPATALAVLLALAVVAVALPLAPAAAAASRGAGAPIPSATASPTNASHAALPAVPAAGAPCGGFAGLWGQVYQGLALAPAPTPTELSGCVEAPDESGLSFASGAFGSGERAEVQLTLPAAGTATAATIARLSVRAWASDASCSLDGAIELSVDLIPPMSPYANGPEANWSVAAPAYDLVPAASCDPLCSNDTALYTFEGTPFCEEQVVADVPGGPPVIPVNGPAPGDSITVTIDAGTDAAHPYTVWVNDTTHPSASLAFSYAPSAMRVGGPLLPLLATSSIGQRVWGMSSALSVVATNCPLPVSGGSACDSYDPAVWSGVAPVLLDHVGFYNASDGSYDLPYTQVGVASSTGGCAGGPIACASGRLGSAYPFWSLEGGTGTTAWSYGVTTAGSVRSFPTGPLDLAPAPVAPIALGTPTLTVGATTAVVAERVTDPTGVASVNLTVSFCAPVLASGALGAGPRNSTTDGVWSATIPASTNSGTVPLLTTVTADGGAVVGPAVELAQVAGTNPACPHAPLAPPTGGGATPFAQGYLVNWSAVPLGTAAVVVQARASDGTTVNTTVAPTSPEVVHLGRANASYNLSFATLNSWNDLSAFSPSVAAGPTLAPLAGTVAATAISWAGGGALLNLSVTASGGLGPYTVNVAWGDGTNTSAALSGSGSFLHFYAGSLGVAGVYATITDALGESGAVAPMFELLETTPLDVRAAAVGGDGIVGISWQAPPSPAGPAVGYRLYSTTNASLARLLASAGLSNATYPGITVWNTTSTFQEMAVPNGDVLYAQVLAYNGNGNGALPRGAAIPLVARPAPFLLSPIVTDPGGPAPLHDSFSASATLGSNDSVVQAYYSFPDGTIASAVPSYVNGTFFLNATYEFLSPGAYVVVLHAVDVFFETQIATTEVQISAGTPPALSALVVSGIAYAGAAVDLQATVTGGSGLYDVNWSFGDGASANGTTTAHVYATAGTYSVLVTAVDTQTGGSASYLFAVLVYAIPTIFVSVTPGPNGSLSYDFRAAIGGGSGPSTVVWTFGDGVVGRGTEVTHDYLTRGTYTVNVTATDPAGRAGATAFNLSANPSSSSGGGASAGGLSLLDIGLVAAAALLLVVVLLLSARRRSPPETALVPANVTEDGEVSLT